MARVKLEFPEPVIFSTVIDIRVDDINYGGHVGNDRFLTLVQEARLRFLRALGYENEASLDDSTGFIVTDAILVYKSELFLGDKVAVELNISDLNKYGFDFFYRIKNVSNGKISAIVKTGVVSFDYKKSKVVKFPEDFFKRIGKLDNV